MDTENDRSIENLRPGMRKIRVALPEDAWHKVEAEWLWAEATDDNTYILRNTPFYALGLSYGDRVRVNDVTENPTMLGVVARGGHSTYRIFAKKGQEHPRVQILFKKLKELHCDIEGATKNLLAVDVLPEADIHKVYATLEQAERAGIIDFEEGHCAHPLSSKPQ